MIEKDIVNQIHFNSLKKKDKMIAMIYDKYKLPPNWNREEGFVSLSKIILEQQVSLASAKAHFLKLEKYIGDFIPENILKLDDAEMRECQISRQKAKYLRELSLAILDKKINLEKFSEKSEEEIRAELTSTKGIGVWTSDIYLMFCLQVKDIFPVGDIAVVNTIKKLYKVNSREEIIAIADKWKPYRSLGTYFMWHYYLSEKVRKFVRHGG